MDTIDKLIQRVKDAVENNKEGDGLGYLDWRELSSEEKKKFLKEFTGISENMFTITYKDREFVIEIYNYQK